MIVTIAEAIAGIEPDPIPAIAIVMIVMIIGMVNSNVSFSLVSTIIWIQVSDRERSERLSYFPTSISC